MANPGVGVPPSVADRIFEPFFTTKEVGKGMGQGLTLGYSLIHDRHNGTLTFCSERGVGTTFVVRIPSALPVEAMEAAVPTWAGCRMQAGCRTPR